MLVACSGTTTREEPAVDVAAARRDGEAAYAAGDWRLAESHYRTLVKAIPQDAELWFRLANIYARTEQPDLAVQAYREALVRDGDLAKAWFNMGVVHLREAANSFMKMQVHVAPDNAMARQGAEAYAAVMGILGRQEGDEGPDPRSAAKQPEPTGLPPLPPDTAVTTALPGVAPADDAPAPLPGEDSVATSALEPPASDAVAAAPKAEDVNAEPSAEPDDAP